MMMIKSNIVFSHISTTLDHTLEFSRFPYFVTDTCNNSIIIGYALRARDQNLVWAICKEAEFVYVLWGGV